MIYILLGDNTKSKSLYIKELVKGGESFSLSASDLNKELIMSYATNISLFGEYPYIIVENILKDEDITFSENEFNLLKESKTTFILKEDKLSAVLQKKYKKYAEIKVFEEKKAPAVPKFNVFGITDAFASRNKVLAWTLYRKAIENGIEPEAISGVLFWKIKTMVLNGSRAFSKDELKNYSSQIVSLYHKAHRGEADFSIGLEQFILASLSSK